MTFYLQQHLVYSLLHSIYNNILNTSYIAFYLQQHLVYSLLHSIYNNILNTSYIAFYLQQYLVYSLSHSICNNILYTKLSHSIYNNILYIAYRSHVFKRRYWKVCLFINCFTSRSKYVHFFTLWRALIFINYVH
jgi:hypothetical protein